MAHRVLRADDAFWRESNQMRVLNTDLGKQLGADTLEMSDAQLRQLYPEGPRALPPELGGSEFRPSPASEPG
ncbi:MAG TPA: hypothetical protein VKC63_11095 [Solirubrobacterales bacterium]|nr:hypothetical protein [Solirubrobacterales bacterium]